MHSILMLPLAPFTLRSPFGVVAMCLSPVPRCAGAFVSKLGFDVKCREVREGFYIYPGVLCPVCCVRFREKEKERRGTACHLAWLMVYRRTFVRNFQRDLMHFKIH
uniref:Putative secreted protein n=1 Tax=Anopheles darlingi TaxID=43151 RepID=A0A2M4D9B1_ANODA